MSRPSPEQLGHPGIDLAQTAEQQQVNTYIERCAQEIDAFLQHNCETHPEPCEKVRDIVGLDSIQVRHILEGYSCSGDDTQYRIFDEKLWHLYRIHPSVEGLQAIIQNAKAMIDSIQWRMQS